MKGRVRIGTRGSQLALWQADHVAALLAAAHDGLRAERVVIRTRGDRILDRALADIGDKGLFTKELEQSLLEGEVDLVVHSMKDVPTVPVPGLVLAAVPARGAPEDAFVSSRYQRLDDLPDGATVATGSLRREAQLRHRRPDLRICGLRGNVPTRLAKLQAEGWDGVILATAGLERLGLEEHIAERLPVDTFVPAVGQGALYLQARAGSDAALLTDAVNDPAAAATVRAERRFMAELEGGCQVPIGAHARLDADGLRVVGFVARRDGRDLVRREARGPADDPEAVGRALAEKVRAAGGVAILEEERRANEGSGGAGFAAPTRDEGT